VQVACSILKICKITGMSFIIIFNNYNRESLLLVVGVKYGPDRFNITIGGKSTNRGLRLEKIIATGKYVKASSDRQVLFEFPDGTDFEV
jgi:hypothetical protein